MKKILFFSCILLLGIIIFSQVVLDRENSANSDDFIGVAYNSITFENETELGDIDVKEDEDTLELTFSLNGDEYKFHAKSHQLKDSNEKAYTQMGIDGNDEKYVNIVTANGYYSGVFGDNGHLVTSLDEDLSYGFGFIIAQPDNDPNLSDLLDDIKDEFAENIEQNKNTIIETND